MSWSKILCPAIAALCCTALAPAVQAQTADKEISRFISGPGTALYLGAGVALPLLLDGKDGVQHSLRALDSFGTSAILCVGLQKLTQVKRPDSDDRDSFPSCHATTAFAVATIQSHYHRGQALLWYGGATLISASRLDLNHHRIQEVLAGAALGYLTGRLELNQKHGLILFPVITSDDNGGTVVGLQVSGSF